MQLFANDIISAGNQPGKLIIDGGNIQLEFPEDNMPVNSYGTPLSSHIITNTDEFHQIFETVSYSYEYHASYSDRFPFIKVYLPDFTMLGSF
jgi:hypothetical protein